MNEDKFSIVTYDGTSKFEGDKVFMVEWKPFLISQIHCIAITSNIYKLYDRHIFFNTHENALDYILLNKSSLNVREIADELGWFFEKGKVEVDFMEMVSLLKSLVFGKLPCNRNDENYEVRQKNTEIVKTLNPIERIGYIIEMYEKERERLIEILKPYYQKQEYAQAKEYQDRLNHISEFIAQLKIIK